MIFICVLELKKTKKKVLSGLFCLFVLIDNHDSKISFLVYPEQ